MATYHNTYTETMRPLNLSHLSRSSSEYSHEAKPHAVRTDGVQVVKKHEVITYLRYWIHFASILVTGGLAALNIKNVVLMDVDDPQANTKLNLFQFVAKAHEVLIVGSMMLIMMDYVRSRLITAQGIPLGYLLSPVLFNDLDWIVSTEFWSCVAKPSFATLPLTALILTAIPFANLAGPLSAILVVPRLGWSKPAPAGALPSFFNASASTIWPDVIRRGDLLPKCATGAGESTAQCPGSGVKVLSVTTDLRGRSFADWDCLNKDIDLTCNTTIDGTHTWSLEYDFYSLSPILSTVKVDVFSPLQTRTTDGFARFLNISGTTNVNAQKAEIVDFNFFGNKPMLKPVVKSTCKDLSYSQIYDIYKDNAIAYNWSTPAGFWLKDIDDSDLPNFVFSWMKNDSLLADARTCDAQDCFKSVACSIDARWIPVSLWVNMQQPDVLHQSDPQPSELVRSGKFDSGTQITIEKGVLELTTLPQAVNISEVIRDILNNNAVPQSGRPEDFAIFPGTTSSGIFFVNYTQAVAMMLGTSIVEFLAEGPTFTGQSIYSGNCSDATFGFEYGSEICSHDASHWVLAEDIDELKSGFSLVSFTLKKNGYGWFFDSITIKIALSILLFHGLLTLLYLIHVAIFRRRLTTRWATAPELLMLAINSLRAPVLMGHSTGADGQNRRLWREPVTIREVDSGDELSLVVGDPIDYSGRVGDLPQLAKKYN